MAEVILPIDPFQITQGFGERPEVYKQFGLAGHNGWDIRTIYPDTPGGRRYVLAPQFSTLYKKEYDKGGFGRYFEVLTSTSKNIWKHTFAHCWSYVIENTSAQGEPMAISDNTGFSSAPHLHWTPKRIIQHQNGTHTVLNYNNGYFGAVNPQEYLDEVRADVTSSPPTDMPTDFEKKKSGEVDILANWLVDIGEATDRGTEQYFDNPADPHKFSNKIKSVYAKAKQSTQPVDTAKIKEEGRQLGLKQVKDAANAVK